MAKRAISVTLDNDNLLWLKGQTRRTRARSVSETIDKLVSEARRGRGLPDAGVRSVVGTVDISPEDPDLTDADAVVRALFDASTRRPVGPRDRSRRAGRASGRSRRRG